MCDRLKPNLLRFVLSVADQRRSLPAHMGCKRFGPDARSSDNRSNMQFTEIS
jgi:hypothetical protein